MLFIEILTRKADTEKPEVASEDVKRGGVEQGSNPRQKLEDEGSHPARGSWARFTAF